MLFCKERFFFSSRNGIAFASEVREFLGAGNYFYRFYKILYFHYFYDGSETSTLIYATNNEVMKRERNGKEIQA